MRALVTTTLVFATIVLLDGRAAGPVRGSDLGEILYVKPTDAPLLKSMIAGAAPGTTILLETGTFLLDGGDATSPLVFSRPGVTMRSATGDAADVTLDGGYRTSELVQIHASDVSIANLTITRAVDHLIHIVPPPGPTNLTGINLSGLNLSDSGEQLVKVNPNEPPDAWVDDGRLEWSVLELTREGRAHVRQIGSSLCYTGGIDAHGARSWQVRHNRFENIYCENGEVPEHAVHFWQGSRDTLVENNLIVNCGRGIGFGLGESGEPRTYPDDPYASLPGFKGHYDGIIRNNIIWATGSYFDTGIGLEAAPGARVLHNTVVSADDLGPETNSIDYRFPTSVVMIQNNLVQTITRRDGASGIESHNGLGARLSDFRNPAKLDFHLVRGAVDAIDRGVLLPDAGLDVDGKPHTLGDGPDLGAAEFDPVQP